MQVPLDIRFHNIPPSDALRTAIEEKARGLEKFFDGIIHCRVTVEEPHRRHHQGNHFAIRIDLTVPGEELVVSRDPAENATHEDAYIVVRDAFSAMKRQLQDYARKRRNEVKRHEQQGQGA